MRRRNRIPYDPPHLRAGKKRRSGPPPRPEQLFMTRRMLLAKGVIVAAFSTLAAKLGLMQLVAGQTYRAAAVDNITRDETIKATRGVVYDRRRRELAINRQTWEVRVRPADLPTDPAARRRVLDQLISALNLPDALILDPTAVPRGAAATVYARTAQLLGKVLAVEPTGQSVRQSIFSVPGQVVRVNGEEMQVFIYPDMTSRKADTNKIAPDGRMVAGTAVPWSDAHFASAGNVLTLLFTIDPRLAARVDRAVATFADAGTFDSVLDTLRGDALRAWTDYIEAEQAQNYLVRLEDDLSTDLAALCRAHLNELPGVRVMNQLDYLVDNGRGRERVVVKTGVPREVALKLEANKTYLPGVELDGGVLVRQYPGGEALSHILGYVGMVSQQELEHPDNLDRLGYQLYEPDDTIGKDGLERALEDRLRGRRGRRGMTLDGTSGAWRVIPGTVIEPVPGRNATLTVDLEFQRAVSEILRAAIRYSNEDRWAIAAADPTRAPKKESGAGAVVAIDPRTGEVLAMVSYPHYDNQLFVDGISQRKYDEYVSEAANKPLVDRALRGLYPPGSSLKPFLTAAALHEKTIDPTTTYSCGGAIQVPFAWDQSKGNDHPCWIWRNGGHGSLDILGALEQSCDIFFYNVGAPRQPIDENKTDFLHYRDLDRRTGQLGEKHYFEGLGIQRIKEHLAGRFWFGQATGIQLPSEADGVVPDGDWLARNFQGAGWSVGDTINVSIGQGYFLTTPLQLALNTAALANGGTIYQPLLVREVGADGRSDRQPVAPARQRTLAYSKEILDLVREGMRRVVHGPPGTARQYADGSSKWALTNPEGEPEIMMAGKTGTAEIGVPDENGIYDRQHAWFAAFAPFDEPEIAIAVLVEDGGEGSSYAVPVADRVMRAWFEVSGQRPRGLVLRPEGGPLSPEASVLAETAAFPPPGAFAAPFGQD